MRVVVIDTADGKPVNGRYTIDTTFGLPAKDDEIFLKSHDYDSLKKAYVAATVRKRRWVLNDFEPEGNVVEIWVQAHGPAGH